MATTLIKLILHFKAKGTREVDGRNLNQLGVAFQSQREQGNSGQRSLGEVVGRNLSQFENLMFCCARLEFEKSANICTIANIAVMHTLTLIFFCRNKNMFLQEVCILTAK